MRCAIVVALVVSGLFVSGRATGQERGIVPFKATIVKIHDKGLELSPFDRNGDNRQPAKSIRFEVADDARFEVVDYKFVDGNLKATRKAIALADLLPTQSISVIAIVAGERSTILVGVVVGDSSSGADAIKLIAKLGGSVRNIAWRKDDHLYEVDLSNTNVSDDALASIAALDQLAILNLSNTKVTDKGIAHLANHPKITDIMLSRTKVTNGVLTHLSTLPTIEIVYVDQTAVTRDAMIRFATNRKLRSFCQISAGPNSEYRIHEDLQPRPDRNDTTPYVYLMKRSIYYGRYYKDESSRRKATTYYHRDGPVGAVLERFDWFPQGGSLGLRSDARMPASVIGLSSSPVGGIPVDALACLWSEPAIGVVELNAGTIAAYGRPFQTIDFFNDVPELVPFNLRTAGQTPPLGFVEDARERGCNVRVIDGPFKKSVRKDAPRGFYSAIFIDITVQQREDAKATKKEDVHFDLLTQEAIQELIEKTTPDGVVCYHTSHRTHEFFKPLSSAAAALGFAWKRVNDDTFGNGKLALDAAHFSSEWLVIARRKEHLARFQSEKTKTRNLSWNVPPADETPAWRDAVEPEMPLRNR